MRQIRLYLDDERPCPQGWELARSYDQAVSMVSNPELEIVGLSLDHDLGACPDCIQSNQSSAAPLHCRHVKTGYDFLCYLESAGLLKALPRPSVHSMNPIGRANMERVIERWYSETEETPEAARAVSEENWVPVGELKPGDRVEGLWGAEGFLVEAVAPSPLKPGQVFVVLRNMDGTEELTVEECGELDRYPVTPLES